MPTELFKVRLNRDNTSEAWGFEISSGKDHLIRISQVEVGGLAEQIGLLAGDVIVQLNNLKTEVVTDAEALEQLKKSDTSLELLFLRNLEISHEDPRYEGLRPGDRKKVGFHDVSKPVLRKDWNCPWVKRDGRGLKNVVRNYFGTEPVPAPIKTSHNHFYSEPHSILAAEPSAEALAEIEKAIQEKLAQEEEEKRQQQLKRDEELRELRKQEEQLRRERDLQEQASKDEETSHNHVQEPKEQQEPVDGQQYSHHAEDEEDFCPGLETIESREEADLEQHREVRQGEQEHEESFENFEFDDSLLKEISKAIMAGMKKYEGCSEGFEPSADELIDVLKNLENLAAANPALYRAIVEQIKVNTPHHRQQDDEPRYEVMREEEEQQANGYFDHAQEEIEHREFEDERPVQENGTDEPDREEECEPEPVVCQEPEPQEEIQTVPKTAEELRKEAIRLQVEREHEEQMEKLRQSKKFEAPKKIVVVAGSRNQAAWPIAPGVNNGTVPRTIELATCTVDDEDELLRSRAEVAKAAGLRHVDVINGDHSFYPEPIKDYDYPWAGSLHPVSQNVMRNKHKKREEDPGLNPWRGSLHHVEQNRRSKVKPDNDDNLYGDAPWMGTLRHVKPESKVVNTTKPQFKRYPDEDAPNPYSAIQGVGAKPRYPLTPAAKVSASGGSKEERERAKQDEEVERIRSSLRETRTVSSSLLKAIMPKLLKEHESKHEALDHMESIRIMEEILGMQIGLNAVDIDDDDVNFDYLNEDSTSKAAKKVTGDKKKKKKKATSKSSTKELEEISAS